MGREPASGLASRNGTKSAGTQNAIAWGSCPGQAIAVRRAAQERRSKQTWTVTPDSTASEKRFRWSSDEAGTTTLKSRFCFGRKQWRETIQRAPDPPRRLSASASAISVANGTTNASAMALAASKLGLLNPSSIFPM
jgi:hypothetical protein